jgi:hypothetical protein
MVRSSTRGRRYTVALISIIAALALALPLPAAARGETFYRFEENATANWTMVEQCADGTTSTTRVTVMGGREFESPDLDDVNEFVTVRIRNFSTCDGEFVNEFGTGPAQYTGSQSLQTAHVSGTVILRSGEEAAIDVSWEGTGPLETDVNQTQFRGFSGVFTSKERQAVATGSVSVDGEDLVPGPSESASIETLEDRNRTTGA